MAARKLRYDWFDEIAKEYNIKKDYQNLTNEELYQKVLAINQFTKIHINNRKRLERALYAYEVNGELIENKKTDKLLYDAIFIGLTTDRKQLYDRINNRVDNMLNNGLLEEAKTIYTSKIRSKAVLTPIGYKELFPYFYNEKRLDECIDIMKQNSRRYAKRQYTWFNNQMSINWFDVDFNSFDNTVKTVEKFINQKNS